MPIQITSYKGFYSCHGCSFYAKENELIVTAEYWEDLKPVEINDLSSRFGSFST